MEYLTASFGSGESGHFWCRSGIPAQGHRWKVDRVDGEWVDLPAFNFVQTVEQSLVYMANTSLNKLDIDTGYIEEVYSWSEHDAPFCHLCVSNGKLLAGQTMLDLANFDTITEFPILGPAYGALRDKEQAAAPVRDGFVYLAGQQSHGRRSLYHIIDETMKIEKIADNISAFLMLPYGETFFAVCGGRLICTHLETGRKRWDRDYKRDLTCNPCGMEIFADGNKGVHLMYSGDHLYLYHHAAFLNKYNAQTGELVSRVDTMSVNWKDPEDKNSRIVLRDLVIADNVFYVIHTVGFDDKISGIHTHSGDLVFQVHSNSTELRYLFTAGDLMFLSDTKNKRLFARDRHNGELLWDLPHPVAEITFGFPIQNKLIFYSVTGSIVCFDWDKVYVSKSNNIEAP